MLNYSPIILFVYKRPHHTLRTLESLRKNDLSEQSSLYIFSDGAKSGQDQASVAEVRQVIRQKQWCKEVHIMERPTNFGLARNIIEGVSQIIDRFGKVIVLEDDLVISPGFLRYMNQALDLYQEQPKVMQISGHTPPIKLKKYLHDTLFYNKISSWGWATWARAWQKLNLDTQYLLEQIEATGQTAAFNADGTYNFTEHLEANLQGTINTWAIKWQASVFLSQGLCLYPRQSLVRNIGCDNSGEHCGYLELYLRQKMAKKIEVEPIPLKELPQVRQALAQHYYQLTVAPTWFQQFKTKVRRVLRK